MYLVITDNCMFKIVKLESAVCENPICNQRIDKTTDEYGLSLIVGDTVYNQSITDILGRASDPRGSFNAEYWCEKCNVGSTKKVSLVHTSDVLMLQLLISKHENNVSQKLRSNLIVHEEIKMFKIQ